jgi:plastocyanin
MRRRITLLLTGVPLILLLGWAAAGAALAGGGCHGENGATATEAASSVVMLDGCTFAPTITRVPAGTEVRWLNKSGQIHDVTGHRFEWGSDALVDGASFAHRFASTGIYAYSCSLHPGMAGIVVVGSPAVAVEDAAQVAAVEPTATSPTSSDTTVPIVAVAAISLLAGAALGALGARAITRRNDAA